MSSPVSALNGEYLDPKNFRLPRTQREAGIDHLQWAHRIGPLHSWLHDVFAPTMIVCTIVAASLFLVLQLKY